VRPDGRCVVRPNGAWTAEQATAACELARSEDVTVIATVDARDDAARRVLGEAGFTESRRESIVELSIDRVLEAFREARLPPGICARSAVEVDVDRLRALDDELRGDVPGTAGWRSSPAEFRENTFDDSAFDPATYLVAVDDDSGEYVGLVRVWMNPGMPRIGMVGVCRAQRRRGIAAALLVRALTAARDAGGTRVTTEFDVTNIGSRALAEGAGAEVVGTAVELAYSP
jgi:RimJ/RimL family protein N-acetyltransferase